jgi:hypothetical protein
VCVCALNAHRRDLQLPMVGMKNAITLNIISEFQPILIRNPSGRVIMSNKEACVTNTWIK